MHSITQYYVYQKAVREIMRLFALLRFDSLCKYLPKANLGPFCHPLDCMCVRVGVTVLSVLALMAVFIVTTRI